MPQAPQPLVFQDQWLLKSITHYIDPVASYSNAVVKKGYIKKGRTCGGSGKSAILRINQFFKITKAGGITAVLSDSQHKILANFVFDTAIQRFENKYRQRITYQSINSLIMIKQADLKFISKFDLMHNYDKSFNSKQEVAILDVHECEIFQRDQVMFNFKYQNSLSFIYQDKSYIKACSIPLRLRQHDTEDDGTDKVNAMINVDYDDMISI